jgi:Nif-specific regulatory protein
MDVQRLARERNLYLSLLELGHQTELRPLLDDALGLVVEATGALQGYLQLDSDHHAESPRFWMAQGFSDAEIASVRATISTGILAEALSTGTTIRTPSALDHRQFAGNPSVQKNRIEAVLCAPLGAPRQGQNAGIALGALYLQGRRGFGPFTRDDEELVEIFARHVAPFVTRVLEIEERRQSGDPTRELRDKLQVERLIGSSPAMARILGNIALLAPRDTTVLITGPSGTGKTAVARAMHDNSPRRRGPFVELNCATIPEALAESELFGARAGSFTGARQDVPGKIKAAQGGTLFLDEIAELSMDIQSKLLTFLDSRPDAPARSYYPLGSTRLEYADVRVIAATNADLRQRVRERAFRDDLLHRLDVFSIRMPGLSERSADIGQLTRYFCRVFSEREQAELRISAAGMQALLLADWPGNVRQLVNTIEAGVIRALGEGCPEIEPMHLFPEATWPGDTGELTYHQATQRFQRGLLAETLDASDWNVTATARRLCVSRSTINLLIRAHGLHRREP